MIFIISYLVFPGHIRVNCIYLSNNIFNQVLSSIDNPAPTRIMSNCCFVGTFSGRINSSSPLLLASNLFQKLPCFFWYRGQKQSIFLLKTEKMRIN